MKEIWEKTDLSQFFILGSMASDACAPTRWTFNRQIIVDRLFISPTFTHSLVIHSDAFFFMVAVLYRLSLIN